MCPSYLDGVLRDILTRCRAEESLARPLGDTRSHRPCEAVLRWHDCAVFKVREEKAHVRVSDVRSLKTQQHEPAQRLAPGPVDIRYRVELEADGMPAWPSPALQVLELP